MSYDKYFEDKVNSMLSSITVVSVEPKTHKETRRTLTVTEPTIDAMLADPDYFKIEFNESLTFYKMK